MGKKMKIMRCVGNAFLLLSFFLNKKLTRIRNKRSISFFQKKEIKKEKESVKHQMKLFTFY